MSSQKKKRGPSGGTALCSCIQAPLTAAGSPRTQSTSVGSVDAYEKGVREQTQTESQTRVLFTSGATAHYNGVNEEQM